MTAFPMHKSTACVFFLASTALLAQHEYTPADWWQHENGVVAFQNEVLKFFYYWFKY